MIFVIFQANGNEEEIGRIERDRQELNEVYSDVRERERAAFYFRLEKNILLTVFN